MTVQNTGDKKSSFLGNKCTSTMSEWNIIEELCTCRLTIFRSKVLGETLLDVKSCFLLSMNYVCTFFVYYSLCYICRIGL